MASTKKTSLGLNQWTESDKPQMTDFNKDNAILDSNLSSLKSRFPDSARLALFPKSGSISTRVMLQDANGKTASEIVSNEVTNMLELSIFKEGDAKVKYRFYPGAFHTSTDAAANLGAPSYRFKNIYASTSVINTSDEATKTEIKEMNPQTSIDFLKALGMTKTFKLKQGTSGRTHYGYTAQQVKAAMDRVGLSDTDFAGWINSPLEDEAGNPTGEYLQGLRESELVNATLFPAMLHMLGEMEQIKKKLKQKSKKKKRAKKRRAKENN